MDYEAPVGQRIVRKDSPLLSLPTGLPPKEHFTLGALAVTAQMVDHAYSHMAAIAARVSFNFVHEVEDDAANIELLHEAWSVVDSIYKARCFVMQLPGWENGPIMSGFVRATEDVWDVRDTFQHLDKLAEPMVAANEPALGALTWIAVFPELDPTLMYGCMLLPGSIWQEGMQGGALRVPGGETILAPVDKFSLTGWRPQRGGKASRGPAGKVVLELHDLVQQLRRLIAGVEGAVLDGIAATEAQHSVTIDRAASTLLVVAILKLGGGEDSSG